MHAKYENMKIMEICFSALDFSLKTNGRLSTRINMLLA